MASEDLTSTSSVVPKLEPIQDGYTPSSASSPAELDGEPEVPASAELGSTDPAPAPKRKGGRKPIYATSEERKQRNRQAQAAFRERRTEYIKQLESTIQHHEETLQTLQQSHRTAADECLMLRYKNSLLERILLEKGIDVQAELRLKGSPHLRPVRHGGIGQASPMQKAMLSRQQQVRQRPVVQPPLQTMNSTVSSRSTGSVFNSGMDQATPSSQQSSPSALRSPAFSVQGSMHSPTENISVQRIPQGQQPQQPQQRSTPQIQSHPYATHTRGHMRNSSSMSVSQPFSQAPRQQPVTPSIHQEYYSTPFQKHYDQLDEEYDAQGDMLDDIDGEEVDADTFIPNFRLAPVNGNISGTMQGSPLVAASGANDGNGSATALPFDYDPMLDADPFGLTASMHFPNPYSFPLNHNRR